jgi:hypothetical protein
MNARQGEGSEPADRVTVICDGYVERHRDKRHRPVALFRWQPGHGQIGIYEPLGDNRFRPRDPATPELYAPPNPPEPPLEDQKSELLVRAMLGPDKLREAKARRTYAPEPEPSHWTVFVSKCPVCGRHLSPRLDPLSSVLKLVWEKGCRVVTLAQLEDLFRRVRDGITPNAVI